MDKLPREILMHIGEYVHNLNLMEVFKELKNLHSSGCVYTCYVVDTYGLSLRYNHLHTFKYGRGVTMLVNYRIERLNNRNIFSVSKTLLQGSQSRRVYDVNLTDHGDLFMEHLRKLRKESKETLIAVLKRNGCTDSGAMLARKSKADLIRFVLKI